MVSCTAIEAQIVFEVLLCLSLVNLPLLASLEERFTYGVLGYFLGVGNRDDLGEGFLVDKATRDEFALFWEAVTELKVEAFLCFRE